MSCRPQSVKHSATLAPRATKMQVLKSCRPQSVIHSLILHVGSEKSVIHSAIARVARQKIYYIRRFRRSGARKCDTFSNRKGFWAEPPTLSPLYGMLLPINRLLPAYHPSAFPSSVALLFATAKNCTKNGLQINKN